MALEKSKKFIFIIILIIFTLTALLANEIANYRYLTYEQKFFKTEGLSKKIILGALGEFSKTLASYLWIKSDFYWHEYKGDWRSDRNIMPLVKLVTLLDPNQVAAYDFGGYHLAMNLGDVHDGILYLKEGLQNNPDNAQLNFTIAVICMRKIKNYYMAAEYAKHAYLLADNSNKNLKVNALRIMHHAYADLGDYKDAISSCELMLKISPGSKDTERYLNEYKSKMRQQ